MYFVWEFDVSYEYIREIPDFNPMTVYKYGFGYLNFDFSLALKNIWAESFDLPKYLEPFWAYLEHVRCPGFLKYQIKQYFSTLNVFEENLSADNFNVNLYNALLTSNLDVPLDWLPFFTENIFNVEFSVATQCMYYVYSRNGLRIEPNILVYYYYNNVIFFETLFFSFIFFVIS